MRKSFPKDNGCSNTGPPSMIKWISRRIRKAWGWCIPAVSARTRRDASVLSLTGCCHPDCNMQSSPTDGLSAIILYAASEGCTASKKINWDGLEQTSEISLQKGPNSSSPVPQHPSSATPNPAKDQDHWIRRPCT